MGQRSGWQEAAQRLVRLAIRRVPPAAALACVDALAPPFARLALGGGARLLPRAVRDFPDRIAPYVGDPPGEADRARLIEARLAFLLTRSVLRRLLRAHAARGRQPRLPIEVDGGEHLDAALAARRGIILASGHFGFPLVVRLVLELRGLAVIGVGGIASETVEVATGLDAWTGARALQRLRAEMAKGRVCLMLADVEQGRAVEAPFLGGRLPIALGAFGLARATGSRLLPAFAVRRGTGAPFRVVFGAEIPLAAGPARSVPAEALDAFARSYAAIASRHPDHLFAYEPLLGATRAGPRGSAGAGPRSRSARR